MRYSILGAVILAIALSVGCGESQADDERCVEDEDCEGFLTCEDGECLRSHETYVDETSHRVCDEVEACGNLGTGDYPETHEDCVKDMLNIFRAAWPPDDCAPEQIDDDGYEQCLAWMDDYACGDVSLVEAAAVCDAEHVCVE